MNFKMKYKCKFSDKKSGFTLIEVIAALAIISIMAAVLVPKVSKYVEEAKKTKALEDVRQVILAVEEYNISSGKTIDKSTKFSVIKSTVKSEVADISSISTINDDMTYGQMEGLINEGKSFELNDGKIKIINSNNDKKDTTSLDR